MESDFLSDLQTSLPDTNSSVSSVEIGYANCGAWPALLRSVTGGVKQSRTTMELYENLLESAHMLKSLGAYKSISVQLAPGL